MVTLTWALLDQIFGVLHILRMFNYRHHLTNHFGTGGRNHINIGKNAPCGLNSPLNYSLDLANAKSKARKGRKTERRMMMWRGHCAIPPFAYECCPRRDLAPHILQEFKPFNGLWQINPAPSDGGKLVLARASQSEVRKRREQHLISPRRMQQKKVRQSCHWLLSNNMPTKV